MKLQLTYMQVSKQVKRITEYLKTDRKQKLEEDNMFELLNNQTHLAETLIHLRWGFEPNNSS